MLGFCSRLNLVHSKEVMDTWSQVCTTVHALCMVHIQWEMSLDNRLCADYTSLSDRGNRLLFWDGHCTLVVEMTWWTFAIKWKVLLLNEVLLNLFFVSLLIYLHCPQISPGMGWDLLNKTQIGWTNLSLWRPFTWHPIWIVFLFYFSYELSRYLKCFPIVLRGLAPLSHCCQCETLLKAFTVLGT